VAERDRVVVVRFSTRHVTKVAVKSMPRRQIFWPIKSCSVCVVACM
jgi:hypothetical protein